MSEPVSHARRQILQARYHVMVAKTAKLQLALKKVQESRDATVALAEAGTAQGQLVQQALAACEAQLMRTAQQRRVVTELQQQVRRPAPSRGDAMPGRVSVSSCPCSRRWSAQPDTTCMENHLLPQQALSHEAVPSGTEMHAQQHPCGNSLRISLVCPTFQRHLLENLSCGPRDEQRRASMKHAAQAERGAADEQSQTRSARQLQQDIHEAMAAVEKGLQQGRTALQQITPSQLETLQVCCLLQTLSLPFMLPSWSLKSKLGAFSCSAAAAWLSIFTLLRGSASTKHVAAQVLETPPVQAEAVMAAVLTLLKRPPAWKEARAALADPQLMRTLLDFEAARVDGVLTRKLARALSGPGLSEQASPHCSPALKTHLGQWAGQRLPRCHVTSCTCIGAQCSAQLCWCCQPVDGLAATPGLASST